GIKILWNDVDFFQNSSISQGRYDKINKTEQFAPFGRPVPLWVTTTTLRPYTLEEQPIDTEEAAVRLERALLARLEELLAATGGEALRTDFVTKEEGGLLTVTLLAECREEIGRTVKREGEIGRIYGTPQEDTKDSG
ncbi:MAG: sporulation protein YqfD, partial [Oscillospiraceae bacterium]|nr:sporulation protein YqfD [Oscillospiraceae bacterium]